MGILILVRHGQSQWNLENRFAGWTDVPLTERGREDAKRCGRVLQERGFVIDLAFTSLLVRAKATLDELLMELQQSDIPIEADIALNERHYGELQGLNKAETAQKYGEEQVQKWRRDFFTRPPGGESIEDCENRTLPFFLRRILPSLRKGKTVLISAHGNSLRPIVKYLDHLTPEATAALEIGLCTPYVYTFDGEREVKKEIIEIPGVFTKGASIREKRVEEGTA